MNTCKYCAEPIPYEVKECPFCNEALSRDNTSPVKQEGQLSQAKRQKVAKPASRPSPAATSPLPAGWKFPAFAIGLGAYSSLCLGTIFVAHVSGAERFAPLVIGYMLLVGIGCMGTCRKPWGFGRIGFVLMIWIVQTLFFLPFAATLQGTLEFLWGIELTNGVLHYLASIPLVISSFEKSRLFYEDPDPPVQRPFWMNRWFLIGVWEVILPIILGVSVMSFAADKGYRPPGVEDNDLPPTQSSSSGGSIRSVPRKVLKEHALRTVYAVFVGLAKENWPKVRMEMESAGLEVRDRRRFEQELAALRAFQVFAAVSSLSDRVLTPDDAQYALKIIAQGTNAGLRDQGWTFSERSEFRSLRKSRIAEYSKIYSSGQGARGVLVAFGNHVAGKTNSSFEPTPKLVSDFDEFMRGMAYIFQEAIEKQFPRGASSGASRPGKKVSVGDKLTN